MLSFYMDQARADEWTAPLSPESAPSGDKEPLTQSCPGSVAQATSLPPLDSKMALWRSPFSIFYHHGYDGKKS